jgi:predicted SAM-dependent methyltransferase
MNEIYPKFEEPKFSSQLFFEFTSWFGRHFKKRKSRIKATSSPLLIDIGVGANFSQGWVHVDFYTIRFRFWKSYTNKAEIETDLRYPLNCPDNIADGLYTGHTLEHLFPNHAYQLLNEMYRILKPKCWLRINVPDLKYAIDFYNGNTKILDYKYKAEAISNLTQNWGHHSTWDEELLTRALEISGFVNIKKVEFGKEGTDRRLIKEPEGRRAETLVMEAQKP